MSDRMGLIDQRIAASIETKQRIGADLKEKLIQAADVILKTVNAGCRVFVIGNGGSAADAQHFESELVGRFLREHRPIPVTSLTTNTSTLTSILNDYDAASVFIRQVQAHVRPGDLLIAITTSGNSPNVINALQAGRGQGGATIALTGESGGRAAELCDILLNAPSDATPRIQEAHSLMIHIICELVEAELTT